MPMNCPRATVRFSSSLASRTAASAGSSKPSQKPPGRSQYPARGSRTRLSPRNRPLPTISTVPVGRGLTQSAYPHPVQDVGGRAGRAAPQRGQYRASTVTALCRFCCQASLLAGLLVGRSVRSGECRDECLLGDLNPAHHLHPLLALLLL